VDIGEISVESVKILNEIAGAAINRLFFRPDIMKQVVFPGEKGLGIFMMNST